MRSRNVRSRLVVIQRRSARHHGDSCCYSCFVPLGAIVAKSPVPVKSLSVGMCHFLCPQCARVKGNECTYDVGLDFRRCAPGTCPAQGFFSRRHLVAAGQQQRLHKYGLYIPVADALFQLEFTFGFGTSTRHTSLRAPGPVRFARWSQTEHPGLASL